MGDFQRNKNKKMELEKQNFNRTDIKGKQDIMDINMQTKNIKNVNKCG